MKRNVHLLLGFFLMIGFSLQAQTDTLLFDDFQDFGPENVLDFPDPDEVGTNNYVNWDQDGDADDNGRPQNWAIYDDFRTFEGDSIAPLDTNWVLGSSSWLSGFIDGNRNWWVLPPLTIVDDQATLHWKSAPFQGPRYTDGYVVMAQIDDYDPAEYEDTLFQQAQMIPPLPDGASNWEDDAFEADSFLFMPVESWIHANRYSDEDYMIADTSGNLYRGVLEPHSVSLAQFSGQTIYIAFLHDSDDDNLISLDDILVLGTAPPPDGTADLDKELDIRFITYPNPAENYVNIMYMLKESANVRLEIVNMDGKLMQQFNNLSDAVGEYSEQIDIRNWPSGQYNIVIHVDGKLSTKTFVKH